MHYYIQIYLKHVNIYKYEDQGLFSLLGLIYLVLTVCGVTI